MDFKTIVVEVATTSGKLNAEGALELDSMSVIAFVLDLETACGLEIQNDDLTQENFRDIDSVVRLLEARSKVS